MSSDSFETYFHERAALADDLADRGFVLDGCVLATTALDALGEIWMHDFPAEATALDREAGGRIPSSIRMARLVKKFAPLDGDAPKVAVVCFAEDWKRHQPASSASADALLSTRLGSLPGELPRAHLDVPAATLLRECPALAANPKLAGLVEEYEYAALLYRFYRCPMVHVAGRAKRTHGFTRNDEVMYMPLHAGFTSMSFGPKLVTRWLRAVASGYVAACTASAVVPAEDIDPGRREEAVLSNRWARL